MDYDAIIVGGGPAGLTAGTLLAKQKFRVLLLDRESFGGQVMNLEWIENYPAAGERTSGPMLASAMVNEAQGCGVEMELGEVVEIESYSGCLSVSRADGQAHTALAVILAGGLRGKKLGIPGEEKFQGKGMIHCALCDMGLYRDRRVAVCGGGDAGIIEALLLARQATRVQVLEARGQLTAIPALIELALANPKLEIRCGQKPVAIVGNGFVTGVKVESVADGSSEILDADGVLVHVGFEPNSAYLEGLVPLDPGGFIAVDRELQTDVPGILAAGDIRAGGLRRVASAVQDGRAAAAKAKLLLQPQAA